MSSWNEIALMRLLAKESTQITLTTDAPGQWGCVGFIEPIMAWFQWQWNTCTINDSIAVKEIFPIHYKDTVPSLEQVCTILSKELSLAMSLIP